MEASVPPTFETWHSDRRLKRMSLPDDFEFEILSEAVDRVELNQPNRADRGIDIGYDTTVRVYGPTPESSLVTIVVRQKGDGKFRNHDSCDHWYWYPEDPSSIYYLNTSPATFRPADHKYIVFNPRPIMEFGELVGRIQSNIPPASEHWARQKDLLAVCASIGRGLKAWCLNTITRLDPQRSART